MTYNLGWRKYFSFLRYAQGNLISSMRAQVAIITWAAS